MAKLNGVVLTATVIEYNGVKYEMVFVTPKAGDILRVDESDYSYVTEGAYYEVDHVDSSDDPQIIDDDGDEFDGSYVEYTLFRKVSEPQTSAPQQYREVKRPAEVGERIKIDVPYMAFGRYKKGDEFIVRAVYRSQSGARDYVNVEDLAIAILDEEYVVLEPIAEQPDDTIEVDGVKYRKVDRAPKVGDFVYMIQSETDLTKGKIYEVYSLYSDGDGRFFDNVRDVRCFSRNSTKRQLVERIATAEDLERQVTELQTKLSEAEAELAAKKAEEEKARDPRSAFAVGDKVRLIKGGDYHPLAGYENGKVFTVKDPYVTTHRGERVQITGGGQEHGYALPEQLAKLTEEGIAEIDRLKVGEYVRITGGGNGNVGDIVLIIGTSEPFYETRGLGGQWVGMKKPQNLVRATDAEVELAKAKAHKASFKVGDYARVVNDNYEHKVGHIVRISDLETGGPTFDFKVDRVTLGSCGYIKAENIEKLSAEEAEEVAKWVAIGRKIGEFKEGDLIEITRYQGGDRVGTIAHVTSVLSSTVCYKSREAITGNLSASNDAIKLIAPVESVVNLSAAN